MLVNAQSICTRAMRLVGIIGAGETADPDDMADAFTVLNEMMDGMKINRLAIVVVERQLFSLTSGTQAYTIGPGGDFNHQRPTWIENAGIISNNNPSQPLELGIEVLTTNQWQAIPTKNVRSALPTKLYYDAANPRSGATAGMGTIYLYPVPSVASLQVALYLPTALETFAALATNYDMPPGYSRMLRYNLGCELAPEHGRETPPEVVAKAAEYYNEIMNANDRPEIVPVDEAILRRGGSGGGYFNYYTGQ